MTKNAERYNALSSWYRHFPAKDLAEVEQLQMDMVLQKLFGYHILQWGCYQSQSLLRASPINDKIRVSFNHAEPNGVDCLADPYQIPIQSDCIDVVVLPHLIEYLDNPKEELNEVMRVLIPEGHVVILGFNPGSQWGLWGALPWKKKETPWNGNFRGIYRIRNWLQQLGCEIVDYKTFFFRPPLSNHVLLHKMLFLESMGQVAWPYMGAAYIIVAQKKVSTLTQIKPRWRLREWLARKMRTELETRN